MQKNTYRQFNELRKQINKQNEYFTKYTETFKRTKRNYEDEELKEIKNELASKGNRANQMEKRISDIKGGEKTNT